MTDLSDEANWEEIILFVDSKFNENNVCTDLDKCLNMLSSQKKELENQLSFIKVKNSDGSFNDCDLTVTIGEDYRNKIADSVKTETLILSGLTAKIEERVNDWNLKANDKTSDLFRSKVCLSDVKKLDQLSAYINCLNAIENASSEIQSCLLVDSIESAVGHFNPFSSLLEQFLASDTKCANLLNFYCGSVLYWYKILRGSLGTDMEKCLQAYNWPQLNVVTKATHNLDINLHKGNLKSLIAQLKKIQLTEQLISRTDDTSIKSIDACLCLPVQYLLSPLHKRFNFHFNGKLKTNNIEKPEWYMTQVLEWLQNNQEFVCERFQKSFEEAGYLTIDAFSQFSDGLLRLVSSKLKKDLESLMAERQENLFAHHIDEALAFCQELENLDAASTYLPAEEVSNEGMVRKKIHHSIFETLTREAVFKQWLLIEKKNAIKKMETILSLSDAWLVVHNEHVNESKIPNFAQHFIVLISTITERYKLLPFVDCQLKFIWLQIELADDFRYRLVQLKRDIQQRSTNQICCSKSAAILNTVACVADMFTRWNIQPFFVKLSTEKKRIELDCEPSSSAMAMVEQQSGDVLFNGLVKKEGAKNKQLGLSGFLNDGELGDLNCNRKETSVTLDERLFSSCIFDEMVDLYQHMEKEMVQQYHDAIFKKILIDSCAYRKNKWLSLPHHKDFSVLSLSSSAGEMLRGLQENLLTTQQSLNQSIFTSLWKQLASSLDDYIYNKIILANHYNEGGAMQINFDMTKNLFSLFSVYTNKPENYFKKVKESCQILSLAIGSLIMLREVLRQVVNSDFIILLSTDNINRFSGKTGVNRNENHPKLKADKNKPVDPVAALAEINVYTLSVEEAYALICLRVDLPLTNM